MTQKEIFSMDGEKNNSLMINTDPGFSGMAIALHYRIVQEMVRYSYCFPALGYLNLILTAASQGATYFINGRAYVLHAGENIIHQVAPESALEIHNQDPQNTIILIFIPYGSIPLLHQQWENQKDRFRDGFLTTADARISLLLKQFLELPRAHEGLSTLRAYSFILEVFIHQIEVLFVENDRYIFISNKSQHDKIQEAKKLIEADLSYTFTISELAKAVGTNEQYLKKYFKEYFGRTVMGYITEKKMEHAKDLILTGEYRVSDVARLTGYKHSTHFTTAFKKYFGFIPNSLKYSFIMAQQGEAIIQEIASLIKIL